MLKVVILMIIALSTTSSAEIRLPAVAGQFYPGDKTELTRTVERYLKEAKIKEIKQKVIGIISPHAGYTFSGWVAGYAFRAIQQEKFDTAILLGQSHRARLTKAAVYPKGKFRTPLGDVEIDSELASEILKEKTVFEADIHAHRHDHVLEVQIPFLQVISKRFKILPILVNDFDLSICEKIGKHIATSIKKSKRETIIVISADFSHYPDYETANKVDMELIDEILKFDPKKVQEKISEIMSRRIRNLSCITCSGSAILSGMYALKYLGAEKIELLKYANSGDVPFGDKKGVVGYAACVFLKKEIKKVEEKMEEFKIKDENQKFLLNLARKTIESYLKTKKIPTVDVKDPELTQPAAVFVTLTKFGDLRGCIGTTVPEHPLYAAVQKMAVESAFGDPRFPPISEKELKDVKIEISILSPLTRVKSADEIKENIHGVVVRQNFRSGLYLPQVWEHFSKKEDFLSSLCAHKAGLRPDAWKDPKTELYIFTVFKFQEE